MADEKGSWKRFQRLGFDSKTFSKRARKAETNTTRHAHKFVLSKLDSLRSAKQHIIIWLVLVGVLMGAVALQMYWNQQAYRTMAWKSGGTYAEATIGPINTLNPLYATTPAELSASKLIFSSLYDYDDTGSLADDLATNMETSKDGKSYVVTLRDDADWSDGTRLTAQDVVFTVSLMKSAEARSIMYGSWTDVTAEALDDRTVKFVLPAQYAAFPHALTFSVLPKHVLENVPAGALRQNAFSVSPVGSGPFAVRLLQPSPDRQHKILNLSASRNYYQGAPRLSRFVLHAYENQDDMAHALRIGEVNAAAGLASNAEEESSAFRTKQYPVNSGVYALFNSDAPALKDRKVRQALQSGTDTARVRKAVGYPVPKLHLPFVEGQLTGKGIPQAPRYNTARAAKMLDSAGWKLRKGSEVRTNKAGQPLELSVITIQDSTYEKVLEELAGQWRKLGIDVKTDVRDQASPTQDFVQTTLQPRNFDVLLYELVIGADPDVYAYWHSSQATQQGYNFANYRDEISDDALSSARGRSEPALRNEKYKAFAERWVKDAAALGLYQSVMRYSYRTSVQPFISERSVPTEADRFTDVIYWAAEKVPVYKTP
jgi:peptide/nickel transport system substrate-binding protein